MRASLVITSLLLLATPTHARVGETVKQVDARYGKPQKVFIDRPDLRKVGYGYRDFMVIVYFSGGVSKRESFGQPGASSLPNKAVTELLALGAAPGTTWKSWKPATAEKSEQFWMRSDGAVVASTGTQGGMGVIVFQDRYFKSGE
jgi:hypothetical protein